MHVIGFKEAQCKNCYKCVRNCEVKAITVKNSQAYIMNERCILCGHCLEVCPQNAKSFLSDMERVNKYLTSKIPTIISIAPSYIGVLNQTSPLQVVTALKKLGFYAIRETAEGAAYITKEYENLLQEHTMQNIITTSCPSVNDLIEIYYPSLVNYMAPVVSPMIAHGMLLKKLYGNEVKIVFLGPCIAKKREAESDERTKGYIDAVLTFEEFENLLSEKGIDLTELEDTPFDNQIPEVNRLYPISSGVLSSVLTTEQENNPYQKFYVHGINNCIELFESMKRGEVNHSFIEVNICNGGCIKGPGTDKTRHSRFQIKLDMEASIPKIPVDESYYIFTESLNLKKEFHDRSPNDPLPSEAQITKILHSIGKFHKEDMLNCGACGYATCQEKAIAVYQGKAELTMCIPYMNERAQSMSNFVLDNTPNIIIIVDSEMKILEFSRAAEHYFKTPCSKAKTMFLFEFIDHRNFQQVLETHVDILGKKVIYEDTGLATLQNIVYMKEQNYVLGIFQDISEQEKQNQQAYKVKIETIEMAQKVIDKQMFVAQEIAGLLGETTAETKVTLTKLRDTILYDGFPDKLC